MPWYIHVCKRLCDIIYITKEFQLKLNPNCSTVSGASAGGNTSNVARNLLTAPGTSGGPPSFASLSQPPSYTGQIAISAPAGSGDKLTQSDAQAFGRQSGGARPKLTGPPSMSLIPGGIGAGAFAMPFSTSQPNPATNTPANAGFAFNTQSSFNFGGTPGAPTFGGKLIKYSQLFRVTNVLFLTKYWCSLIILL